MICSYHDKSTGPVSDQAAIAHRERIGHHAGAEYIGDAQRSSVECLWVQLGPLPGRYRYLGQVLAPGTELVHVTAGRECVSAQRAQGLIRRFIRLRVQYHARLGNGRATHRCCALGTAIANQHGIALLGLECPCGRHDVGHETRPAKTSTIDIGWSNTQVLDH